MRQPCSLSRYCFVFLTLVLLVGCSSNDVDQSEPAGESVEVLYNKAAAALDEGNYAEATRAFEGVERQHPYSQWATEAQLMAAYSSYEAQRYDEAIIALDRFIELHPGNDDIDYAHYLKALSYYEQISDVARDQAMTEQALLALETLTRRFPDSEYTRDANLKRDLTYDHLAGKEMEIGRYYLNRGHVNESNNRCKSVMEKYETSSNTAEALHRLVEAYLTLGLTNEATQVASVLGYNYPGSKWYERSFELLVPEARKKIIEERGFVDRTVDSIFKPE